ncbi:hypothetical protein OG792_13325 [Micromonospora sp. NBC_01699]|uniref:hypothetical protein n=1 Tax=Micromonospora sp. NBC_01699 TaxID=2975984 RepID=UPI002E337E8A|nr:hypothetical protein [Micromonospora sp. NBC_01699]
MSQQDGAYLRVGDEQTDASDPEDALTIRGYTIDIQIVEDPQVEIDAETPWHLAPEDHNRNRKGPNAQPSRPAL